MFEVLYSFPQQVREALAIGRQAPYFHDTSHFPMLLFCGMGGSAIAGDLLRCLVQAYEIDDFFVHVHRTYGIPSGISSSTAVIASSYSGNTEETLTAYRAARSKTHRLLCITTGGELQRLAHADGVPVISIPSGLQPRCALGYSFVPVIMTLLTHNAFNHQSTATLLRALDTLPEFLETTVQAYSVPIAQNPAYTLAERLHGTIPVIYSSSLLEAVNLRWRGQLQENAKHLAFGNSIPEMNHNEINSWVLPRLMLQNFTIIFLHAPQRGQQSRMDVRMQATKNVLQGRPKNLIDIVAEGTTLLEQMFHLLVLADWTSYWLALLNQQDPTEISDITALKQAMAQH